jgi:WS/DGAT/MGAT family acyltransferase
MASYERLSASDRIFLEMEDHDAHLHVTGCLLFEATPLRQANGAIDFDRICRYVESRLHRIPRYRQRILTVPIEGDPIWVDDPRFNLQYHVRHTHLPFPGDDRQLKRLIGRIVSQMLDRGKPLWEMWIVDGLEKDRAAVITKVHHCMTDGVGSLELMASLLGPEPKADFEPGPIWLPRPAPERRQLLREALSRRLEAPVEVTRGLMRAARDPRRTWSQATETTRGLLEARALMATPASETPINQPIGPHRRFDWTSMDLARVKEVKNRVGGTVNDVALTVVAGAFSRFLELRGVPLHQQRHLDFRAACPVNMRTESELDELGNRVANLTVKLPLAERDPLRRLALVQETMSELKASSQLHSMGTIERIGELTHPSLLTYFARENVEKRSSNFIFTNVPGPQTRWYLLDAPLVELYPVAPLLRNQTVSVALMSYCGSLYWGFNSDWEQVPDLHELVLATEHSFEELREFARKATERTARAPSPSPARAGA